MFKLLTLTEFLENMRKFCRGPNCIFLPRVLAVIDHIELAVRFITPEPLPAEGYTDPDDIMFAEVFITSNADALIKGNLRYYKSLLKQDALVLSPAQFMEKVFPKQS